MFVWVHGGGEVRLNGFGRIVEHTWLDLAPYYQHVSLGANCIMPDHVHGIIILNGNGGGSVIGEEPSPEFVISSMIPMPDRGGTRPCASNKRHALLEIV